jgi:hypothetical protein
MAGPVRILHLEDDAADAELVRASLEAELDCALTHARCREEFVAGLANGPYDMIISDFSLPGFDGFSALLLAQEKLPEVPRLLVSGAIGEESAVEALKAGVADCVMKENLKRLVPAVRRALEEAAGARERRRLDEALHASQQSLRRYAEEISDLYNNSPVGYHSLDGRGSIRRINDVCLAWLGYSRQELVGKRPFWDLLAPQSRAAFQAAFQNLKATGWMPPQEHELVRKDGSLMPVLLSATAIRDAAGGFLMSRSTIVDITEQKRAREEKAKLEDLYHQSQKMEAVGLLAGGIAHDFGNILACIVGNNYFVLEDLKPGHRLRPYCLEIQRSVEMAATLTRQLLGVSGNRGVQRRALDPNSVILAMVKMLHRLLGENIRIDRDLHRSVWPVKMDSGQLEQIILNLAVNARDAMPKGGRLTLATRNLSVKKDGGPPDQAALAPGRYTVLEVRDTGTGMDAAVRKRIFEPFFTTKGPGRGTGLGLSTVKDIAQQYHGRVSVESEPGRGAVFRVCLPSVKGGAKTMLHGPVAKKGKGGSEAILVVEDHGSLTDIIKKTLQGGGYSVFAARSAEQALSRCGRIKGRIA